MKIYSERIKNILVESLTLNVFNISFSTGTILWTLFKLVWEFSASNVFGFLHLQERHIKGTYIR